MVSDIIISAETKEAKSINSPEETTDGLGEHFPGDFASTHAVLLMTRFGFLW